MDIAKYRKNFLWSSKVCPEQGRKLRLNSPSPHRAMLFTKLFHCNTKKYLTQNIKISHTLIRSKSDLLLWCSFYFWVTDKTRMVYATLYQYNEKSQERIIKIENIFCITLVRILRFYFWNLLVPLAILLSPNL